MRSACSISARSSGVGGAREGVPEQHGALGELAGEVVLAREDLALELVAPGSEQVGPGLDRILPAARPVDLEAALPAHAVEMGVDLHERSLPPAPLAGPAVARHRAQHVVAVPEDVRAHGHGVARAALGGIAAAVDRRCRVLDLDPPGWLAAGLVGH